MKPTLYIVGTGPGDPDLLTVKAINTLESCPVIVSPKASAQGLSTALSIVSSAIELKDKTIYELHFPMKKIISGSEPDPAVLTAWRQAAATVLTALDQGLDVAFPTLGDPAIYSTGYYLYQTICDIRKDINTIFIPGISAMSSCSASTSMPICLGNETVAVIPATFSETRIREALQMFDTIVLMKVHRVMDRLIDLLDECNVIDYAVLVEQAGMKSERIIRNIKQLDHTPHYFSTMIVRKAHNL